MMIMITMIKNQMIVMMTILIISNMYIYNKKKLQFVVDEYAK